MKFGVCVPNYGDGSVEDLRRLVSEAESLGFDSLWTTDHILVPRNSGTPYERILDSITTLSFLIPLTNRVRLGISSLIIAMRNPVVVARQLATIDNLSGGRLTIGIGAGWNEKEFSYLGSNFNDRGKRVDESIKLIRELWEGKAPSFSGEFVRQSFSDVAFEPRPIQKRLPVWIGGNSKAAMKRAARLGDVWHPNMVPIEKFKTSISDFRESFPEAQSKPIRVRIALNINAPKSVYTTSRGEQRILLSSNAAENSRIIRELEDLGVDYLVLAPNNDGKSPVEDQIQSLKSIQREFF